MSVFKQNSVFAGRYFLEELIGEGGFSEVWKVHDIMADKAIIAVKIYAPEKGLDNYGIRQFRQEYSITNPLSHPHLMKVYYFDINDGSPYLIMPYYAQGSLAKQLQETGIYSENQIALLMCQMGSALLELHQQQPPILHQDIKPDNILVQKADHFVLTDFGISSKTRQTLKKSTTKIKPLTVGYAPPERFDKIPAYNSAGDVFSLGVTLYEMCTGHIPWDGNGGQSLLKGAHIPALPILFPKELNRMLEACMAADWTNRPSAEQIMNWGKFYLENGYWKFENQKQDKSTPNRRYMMPIFAIGGVALVGTLLFASINITTDSNGIIDNSIVNDSSNAVKITPTYETILEEPGNPKVEPVQPPNQNPVVNPDSIPENINPFTIIKTMEEFLNKISNPKFSRAQRKQWKTEVLQQFVDKDIPVINEKDGLGDGNPASFVLDILMDVPHHVKVKKIKKNKEQKITELVLELEPSIKELSKI